MVLLKLDMARSSSHTIQAVLGHTNSLGHDTLLLRGSAAAEAQVRTFVLRRLEDVSGVSGTGAVAEGIEFHDGQCVISWFGRLHSVAIYPDIEGIIAVPWPKGITVIDLL